MSRIYFHSEHGEAEVHGPERAAMGILCDDLFQSALGVEHYNIDRLRKLFPADHYASTATDIRTISTAIAVDGRFFTPKLNTALVMGSDVVKLMARLHGQCEIHAYVEGEDREWLAAIVERGRKIGLLREKMGWESTMELLRSRNDGPVVTSYSVCEQFPNRHVADWQDENDGDDWYELPEAERWAKAMAALRGTNGFRIQPATWEDFYFEDGATAFTLMAPTNTPAHRDNTP